MSQEDDLERAERYQRLFVTPVVEGVKRELEAQLAPLIEARKDHENRIARLEHRQGKAILGYTVFTAIGIGLLGPVWEWFKQHFFSH